MAKDLRTYLDELLQKFPEQLKVVEDEIDPEFEATAIVDKIENDVAYPGFPAVLFKHVKGSKIPLLLNLHGSYDRISLAIGSDMRNMVEDYASREGSGIPPTEVPSERAPVHEVVLTGDDIDISQLPFLLHQELDAGKYITSAATLSPNGWEHPCRWIASSPSRSASPKRSQTCTRGESSTRT